MSEGNGFFIDDGQELQGFIAAVPRLHPALRFSYRPTLYTERTKLMRRVNADEADMTAEIAHVANKLTSWNAGREPTKENIEHLPPSLTAKLINIVTGYTASDPDPDGLASQHLTEEDREKNSATV